MVLDGRNFNKSWNLSEKLVEGQGSLVIDASVMNDGLSEYYVL